MAKYINRSSVYNQMNIKLTRQLNLPIHLENIKTDLVRKKQPFPCIFGTTLPNKNKRMVGTMMAKEPDLHLK